MRLLKTRIFDFQSFRDSEDIFFSDGINLVVGQNNVGKTSVLRAMQPDLADDKHRTPARYEQQRLPLPKVDLTIDISGTEMRDALLRQGRSLIPISADEDYSQFMERLLLQDHIPVTITHRPGSSATTDYPGHGQFVYQQPVQKLNAIVNAIDGDLIFNFQPNADDHTAIIADNIWRENMYYFTAERMNIGVSQFDTVPRLSPNAANLPSVLNVLQGTRGDVFRMIVDKLCEIFPTVGNVSVRPSSSSLAEIRVWPTKAMQTFELSFPLLQCGTGVAQVMAILVAVVTTARSVLIIDEINSFLHPAAVKSLLRILQTDYSQHQYIISTHSPEVISYGNPRSILLVKREGYESQISRLDLAKVDALRDVAEHLGVSMADVFAADRVIWVEGPTEELCFPLLYKQATGQYVPAGTVFTSVMATGDFISKRRDKELVYQIYRRLTDAAVPLVVKTTFSFDGENLTDAEKIKMISDSKGSMNFLPRRHIECYLIHPIAISAFINERGKSASINIDVSDVQAKLIQLSSANEFKIKEWNNDLTSELWSSKVDAANLIAQTCAEVTNQRITFNKKDDTLLLLKLVQSISPKCLDQLGIYVENLVKSVY